MKNSNRVQNNGIAVKNLSQAEKSLGKARKPKATKGASEIKSRGRERAEFLAEFDAREKSRRAVGPLNIELAGFARGEWPDSLLVRYICRSICQSAEALANSVGGIRDTEHRSEQMEVLLMALRFENAYKEMRPGEDSLCFNVPGLARNKKVKTGAAFTLFASLLHENRAALIKNSRLPSIWDTLCLVESLVIAEAECCRAGYATEINEDPHQITSLQRLALIKRLGCLDCEIWEEIKGPKKESVPAAVVTTKGLGMEGCLHRPDKRECDLCRTK